MKIGIDLGGSHIAVGLINEQEKIIQKEQKDLIAQQEEIEKVIINTIVKYIDKILKQNNLSIHQIEQIGIGSPGTIVGGEIVRAQNLGIQHFKILEELRKYFSVSMKLTNDAKCAAIASKKTGKLKEFDNCVFLTIGTGIGGAVFWNGELLKPKRYPGFEIGHMIIQKDNGLPCKCGKSGCFEKYASITALKNMVKKAYKIQREISGLELHEWMINHIEDIKMQEVIEQYVKNLAIGIGNLIDIFEPEVIGLGGSFAHYEEIFLMKLITILPQYYFGEQIPQIIIAKDKNDAGIIGAVC